MTRNIYRAANPMFKWNRTTAWQKEDNTLNITIRAYVVESAPAIAFTHELIFYTMNDHASYSPAQLLEMCGLKPSRFRIVRFEKIVSPAGIDEAAIGTQTYYKMLLIDRYAQRARKRAQRSIRAIRKAKRVIWDNATPIERKVLNLASEGIRLRLQLEFSEKQRRLYPWMP